MLQNYDQSIFFIRFSIVKDVTNFFLGSLFGLKVILKIFFG